MSECKFAISNVPKYSIYDAWLIIFDIEKMLYYTLYSEFCHPKQSIIQWDIFWLFFHIIKSKKF